MADYWCDDGWDKLPPAANEAWVKAEGQSPLPQDNPGYRQKQENCQFSLNKEEKLNLKKRQLWIYLTRKNIYTFSENWIKFSTFLFFILSMENWLDQ